MKSDEQLAQAASGGDDAAFQELMKRHIKRAFALARLYVKADEDAEDIVQDSFFKAWKNLSRFDADKRFGPWLSTIVRNTALDFLKKKRGVAFSALDSETAEGDSASFADTLVDAEPLADELFAKATEAAEAREALLSLHPDHQSALMLHYRDEMTFEEIAVVMGRPMNTVKSWHRRALGKLKAILHQKQSGVRISPTDR